MSSAAEGMQNVATLKDEDKILFFAAGGHLRDAAPVGGEQQQV